jgi:hypothetical protein
LVIGYLPFLAFFDILIQSGSRAAHLRGTPPSGTIIGLRHAFALVALASIAGTFAAGLSSPLMIQLLLLGAWPLGALGFVWERWIARPSRQWLLSGIELLLLAAVTGLYHFAGLPWQILMLAIVSFPIARLTALALPTSMRKSPATSISKDAINTPATTVPLGRRWISTYIGASLAQQLVAAAATSLPAIHAQLTGDWTQLSVHVAIFRSFHSFAAILSLTINAMSSRIFYRQTGAGFESFERRILDYSKAILMITLGLAAVAAAVALLARNVPIAFGLAILPVMAMVNAESSMLYNRGLPLGTLHCQMLIFLLSVGLLSVLIGHPAMALIALAFFAFYTLAIIPSVLRSHGTMLACTRRAG